VAANIKHTIDIEARASHVWAVIADLSGYASWNPFLVDGRGDLVPGERLRLRMQLGARTMTFAPTVEEVDEGRQVRWLGRLGLPGIFDGEHVLEVETIGPARARFTQREEFRGVLVPFMRSLLRSTDDGFRAMNEALKALVERAA
jgi:hypothetical protein